MIQTLARERDVTNIVSPLDHPRAGLFVSADRHSALVQFDVRGKAEDAAGKMAPPVLGAVDRRRPGTPSLIIEEFGQASAGRQLDQRFAHDIGRAEFTSLPLTLGILLSSSARWSRPGYPYCSRSRRCSRRPG